MQTKLDDGKFQYDFEITCGFGKIHDPCFKEEFIGKEISRIRDICGPKGRVIGAVSGGVDSTVAAKLMHEAIGDRYATVHTPLPVG